ncbi:DUF4198 domain-containing protein [Hymenobacter seoulensis]
MHSVSVASRTAAFAAICLLGAEAVAREFWLEPARFFVMPGTKVHVRRLIGENFQGSTWPGQRNRLVCLLHLAPGQPAHQLLPPALPPPPDTLSTTLTFQQPGTHVVALATTEVLSMLPALEFTAYLKKEGLDHALALREQRGEAATPGREAYRRCAKTLVQVGGPERTPDTTRTWARPIGLPLELLPEQNPLTLPPNAALTVRVLAEGKPVAGQQVVLWRRGGVASHALVSKLRSNQNGRVLFRIAGPGEYLISTVRITAAPAGQETDWQSTWSSLTFGIRNQKHP